MQWRAFILFLVFLPVPAYAAIVINEVAWMGNTSSANDEWIELYNNGDFPVSVEGWTLQDGMNLSIPLSGTINAHSYVVLERTDDASAPGTAFLIYTGALANTGATLTLLRGGGGIEDQVFGGDNWEQIGGDNTTKETAQYTISGWVTAESTPGAQNNTIDSAGLDGDGSAAEEENESDGTIQPVKKNTKKKEIVTLELPDVELTLDVVSADIVYVNQSVSFTVDASGLGKSFLDSLVYEWNFGDLATSKLKSPSHTFSYPGEYVVTVYASFARHEQIGRKNITVLPVMFSITQNLRGDIQIHNNAKYEVNISKYSLRSSNDVVTFPDNTIVLPNGTITVPKTHFASGEILYVTLLDQEKSLVAVLNTQTMQNTISHEKVVLAVNESTSEDSFIFSEFDEEVQEVVTEETDEYLSESNAVSNSTNESQKSSSSHRTPLFGLAGVMVFGILGVYFSRPREK